MSWKDNVYGVKPLKPKFVDAQKMAKEHPKTFNAPSAKELNNLKVGDTVKVCNDEERFWTIIKSINGEVIEAKVDNVLGGDYGYNRGDIITFEKKNIYSIY